MLDIVKIEWLKLRYYSAFWWILGITALTYPGLNAIMLAIYHKAFSTMKTPEEKGKLMIGNPFGFNEVWHTVGYFSSWFVFVPAILVIMLITNEYTFKTHRQNVIDGWRRRDFIMGKLLDVGFVAGLITLIYIAACVTIGLENTAAGDQRGESRIVYVGYFLLQTFSQLSIAFLIGFLLRSAAMSLGLFIFSSLILEPLLGRALRATGTNAGHFLPFEVSNRLIPPPVFWGKIDPAEYQRSMAETGHHVIYTVVFTAAVWMLCFRLNSRRDL